MNSTELAVIQKRIRSEFRSLVDANASDDVINAKARELGASTEALDAARLAEFNAAKTGA